MSQYVFVTGTNRPLGLGFNFVRRYLEAGDCVIATARRQSEALEELKKQYPDRLHLLTMDIASTPSVEAAAQEAARLFPRLDLLINNAVTASKDSGKLCVEADLDLIPYVFDVGAVGPLRVTKALLPLLEKGGGPSLIVNITSEAGSIGKCFRVNSLDYSMTKAALNMGTMIFRNYFREKPSLNIICVHPGWMRTHEADTQAPLDPYDAAETMRLLFEKKRCDKEGDVFVTYEGERYPW